MNKWEIEKDNVISYNLVENIKLYIEVVEDGISIKTFDSCGNILYTKLIGFNQLY